MGNFKLFILTTSQINILQCLCGVLLLIIPLVWPKYVFNESQQKFYKRLRWGALWLVIPFVFACYLGNLKDRNNDIGQTKSEQASKNLKDTLSSIKSELKAYDLIYDEKTNRILSRLDSPKTLTKIEYKDTSFGKTTVTICDERSMQLVATKTPRLYEGSIAFCTSSSDVENFEYSIYVIVKNGAFKKYELDSLSRYNYGNDFSKSLIFNQSFKLTLSYGQSIADTILLYIKYNWANKKYPGKRDERRLLMYNESRGFFTMVEDIPVSIKEFLVENKAY